MSLTVHRNTAISLIITGTAEEIFALLRGPDAVRDDISLVLRCIRRRQEGLPAIRATRRLTGDKWSDWCRGEERYVSDRTYALARLREMLARVIRLRTELAAMLERESADRATMKEAA